MSGSVLKAYMCSFKEINQALGCLEDEGIRKRETNIDFKYQSRND